jgi:hypothetical protein
MTLNFQSGSSNPQKELEAHTKIFDFFPFLGGYMAVRPNSI